ncbi:MAG TPA: hypothetical protein VIZ65_17060 [Cellvibrionaceae bacterium]
MRGAGGTSGGVGQFFLGFAMMCAGFYLLFNAISVYSSFGLGSVLFQLPIGSRSAGLTSGMVFIPFIIGIGIIFYSGTNFIGWLLAIGSLSALIVGVISSLQFTLRSMSAFELIVIFVLAVGGLGLFLRSLRSLG